MPATDINDLLERLRALPTPEARLAAVRGAMQDAGINRQPGLDPMDPGMAFVPSGADAAPPALSNAPAPAGAPPAAPAGQGHVFNVGAGAVVNVGSQGAVQAPPSAPAPAAEPPAAPPPAAAAPAPAANAATQEPPVPPPPAPTAVPPAPPGTALRREEVTTRQATGVPAAAAEPLADRAGTAAAQARVDTESSAASMATVSDEERAIAARLRDASTPDARIEALRAQASQLAQQINANPSYVAARGYHDPSTRQAVMEGLGMGLGVLGQAMIARTGKVVGNPAVEAIEAAMQRDTAMLRADAEANRNDRRDTIAGFRALSDALGSAERAANARQAMQYRGVALQLRALAQSTANDADRARLLQSADRIDLDATALMLRVAQAQYPEQTTTTQTEFRAQPTGGGGGGWQAVTAANVDTLYPFYAERRHDATPEQRAAEINAMPVASRRQWQQPAGAGAGQRGYGFGDATEENDRWMRMTATQQNAEIERLGRALADSEGAFHSVRRVLATLASHGGQVDNTGRITRFAGPWLSSDEGRAFKQEMIAALNAYIYAMSGKQINESEMERFREQAGFLAGYEGQDLVNGFNNIMDQLRAERIAYERAAAPQALEALRSRGYTPLTGGSSGFVTLPTGGAATPSAPAAPASPAVPIPESPL